MWNSAKKVLYKWPIEDVELLDDVKDDSNAVLGRFVAFWFEKKITNMETVIYFPKEFILNSIIINTKLLEEWQKMEPWHDFGINLMVLALKTNMYASFIGADYVEEVTHLNITYHNGKPPKSWNISGNADHHLEENGNKNDYKGWTMEAQFSTDNLFAYGEIWNISMNQGLRI